MSIPVQPKVDEKYEARAPYNFIPLPEKVVTIPVDELPNQGVYDPNLYTGYIDCELTTSSPVYVRAGLTPEQVSDGKQSKELPGFFYLDDEKKPVIPGSSLRGMLRTLIEIVTFSKIGSVMDRKLVYRAVGDTTSHGDEYRRYMMSSDGKWQEQVEGKRKDSLHFTPKILGGYIVRVSNNDWAIRPAQKINGTTYSQINITEKFDEFYKKLSDWKGCKAARKIYVKTGKYEYQPVKGGSLFVKFAKVTHASDTPKDGFQTGVLLKSGYIDKKKSEVVIYEPNEKAGVLPISDDLIDIYRDQLRLSKEQMDLLGDQGVLQDGHPVFYVLDEKTGKLFFFGHTRMFRVPYPNSPFDYVPKEIKNNDDIRTVDLAEAIFGFTRNDGTAKERAYSGRVSFTDAELIENQGDPFLSNEPITLQILSGPKPTTFQHYLVQTQPHLVQIGQTKDGKPKYAHPRSDYSSPTPSKTVIRGHKFYWHKGAIGIEDIREQDKLKEADTQHTQISPLKAGVKFRFCINFENLKDEELGALMWILKKSESEEFRLKIGMGKPLGMGAISIHSTLYTKNPSVRYGKLLTNETWHEGLENNNDYVSTAIKAFLDKMNSKLGLSVEETERIQALLHILSWPGPNPEKTSYMSIQKKEYKNRPILPSPFGVWSKHKK